MDSVDRADHDDTKRDRKGQAADEVRDQEAAP
jgi:hypothetical protein